MAGNRPWACRAGRIHLPFRMCPLPWSRASELTLVLRALARPLGSPLSSDFPGDYVSYQARTPQEVGPVTPAGLQGVKEITDLDEVEATYAHVGGVGIGEVIVTQAPGGRGGEGTPVVQEPASLL